MKKLFLIIMILFLSGCTKSPTPYDKKLKNYDDMDKFGMFLYDVISGSKQ